MFHRFGKHSKLTLSAVKLSNSILHILHSGNIVAVYEMPVMNALFSTSDQNLESAEPEKKQKEPTDYPSKVYVVLLNDPTAHAPRQIATADAIWGIFTTKELAEYAIERHVLNKFYGDNVEIVEWKVNIRAVD